MKKAEVERIGLCSGIGEKQTDKYGPSLKPITLKEVFEMMESASGS